MNKFLTPALIVVAVLVLGGGIFFFQNQRSASRENGQMTQDELSTPTIKEEQMEEDAMVEKDATDEAMMEGEKTITLTEIAEHNSADDCWFAIEEKVYDATEYIAGQKHPGGVAIVQGCGTDATEIFNERPNGSGSHSEKARGFLPNYEIGVLADEASE